MQFHTEFHHKAPFSWLISTTGVVAKGNTISKIASLFCFNCCYTKTTSALSICVSNFHQTLTGHNLICDFFWILHEEVQRDYWQPGQHSKNQKDQFWIRTFSATGGSCVHWLLNHFYVPTLQSRMVGFHFGQSQTPGTSTSNTSCWVNSNWASSL